MRTTTPPHVLIQALLLPLFLAEAPAKAPPAPPAAEAAPPVIRRGDRVTLSARVGAVVASVEAESLQDGRVGDTVRVKNLQSGKVQPARVVSAGQVEVLL